MLLNVSKRSTFLLYISYTSYMYLFKNLNYKEILSKFNYALAHK